MMSQSRANCHLPIARQKPPWTTNQLFEFGVTNSFGAEGWNSYTNAYGRPLRLVVSNFLTLSIIDQQSGVPQVNVVNLPYGNIVTFGSRTGASPAGHIATSIIRTSPFRCRCSATTTSRMQIIRARDRVVPIAPTL